MDQNPARPRFPSTNISKSDMATSISRNQLPRVLYQEFPLEYSSTVESIQDSRWCRLGGEGEGARRSSSSQTMIATTETLSTYTFYIMLREKLNGPLICLEVVATRYSHVLGCIISYTREFAIRNFSRLYALLSGPFSKVALAVPIVDSTQLGAPLDDQACSAIEKGQSTPTPTPPPDVPENEGTPSEDSEKPRVRRTRLTLTVSKDAETLQLPEDLDVLWAPESEPPEKATSDLSVLPPDDIFDDALHNLHIALHPQTQHKATYATGSTATEPTLALCCPIEGGEYIIDATVRELGRRTGAEVIELDAVQLAAGEWGHFGKAGSAIQLPQNPLHFASSSSSSTPTSRSNHNDEDDDQDMPTQMFPPQQMTLTLMTSASPSGRTVISPPSRRTSTPSRARIFFDALVNTPSKQNTDDPQPSSSTSSHRPRLIYVRDFQTLAATSSTWYPPLLSAVRQRRRGPISRPSSPVSNPMVIVFGISPSLTPPSSLSPQGAAGFVNLLMNRSPQSNPSLPHPRPPKGDWTEDPASEKARERRLRDRMRRWEQGEASLQFEIPKLASGSNESEGNPKPDVVVIGGPRNLPFLPPFLRGASTENADESDESDTFFRTSVTRDQRTDNENGRWGVGGILDKEVTFAGEEEDTSTVTSALDEQRRPQIWADWGQRIEPWSNVRSIADRAVGSAMGPSHIGDKPTLEPTPISWILFVELG
ncbi:AAA-domain-containing protein [Salix suchowensis]|nr:AAA-domain-containing protein [Salix suchowensis]